jgi:peptidoglycan/LPS O-acetylase OafA/YrhL
MTTTNDNRRYYGLDALRGGMMLLGVVLHSAEFYITSPPPAMAGLPIDANGSYLFDLVFHFIHSFRMPLFFVLAGFFAALLVEKRGLAETYKDRAKRILAPLLVGVLTIVPVAVVLMLDLMVFLRFGVMDALPERAKLQQIGRELEAQGIPAHEPSILHLWFLLYLCYFYLAMPAIRWVVDRTRPGSATVAAFLGSPLALIALGLFTAATLWPYRGGQVHEGFFYLKPHLPSIVYYGSFFAFGYFFHAHRAVLDAFKQLAPACAWASAILFPLSLWLSYQENNAVGNITGYHLAAVVAHGFCTWALIYAFTGWMLRRFDRESPWILYVSQSAYWVYLVHMDFAIFAALILAPCNLPGVVKFAIVFSFVTIACFTSYHYLVQRTWVSRFLHGKTFDLDWPWRVTPGASRPFRRS